MRNVAVALALLSVSISVLLLVVPGAYAESDATRAVLRREALSGPVPQSTSSVLAGGHWQSAGVTAAVGWGDHLLPLASGDALFFHSDPQSDLMIERFSVTTQQWTVLAPPLRRQGNTGPPPPVRFDSAKPVELADGRVLVATSSDGDAGPGAVIYDPSTNGWKELAVGYPSDATPVRLRDGRVLIVHGSDFPESIPAPVTSDSFATRQTTIWDPGTERYTAGPSMLAPRRGATVIALLDGRALVTSRGGGEGGVEVYDPKTDTFAQVIPPERISRVRIGALLLADGRVLLGDNPNPPASFAFLVNPEDWSVKAIRMTGCHDSYSDTPLLDGTVLRVGVESLSGPGKLRGFAELYDLATDSCRPTDGLTFPRGSHRAARLADGSVLVVAGQAPYMLSDPTDEAERYFPSGFPAAQIPAPVSIRERFRGPLPRRGTASQVVWGGGTVAAAVKAADLQDCSLASVWIRSGGQLVGYVPGAPELVNRPFESVVSGLVIPTLSPITVFCGTVVTHPDGLFAIDVPSDWELDRPRRFGLDTPGLGISLKRAAGGVELSIEALPLIRADLSFEELRDAVSKVLPTAVSLREVTLTGGVRGLLWETTTGGKTVRSTAAARNGHLFELRASAPTADWARYESEITAILDSWRVGR